MKLQEEQFLSERRLSPWTIFYRIIASLPSLIIPFYFAFYGGSVEEWIYIILGALYGVIIFPSIVLSYYYYTYLITPDEVVINSGVFSRKQRNIPVDRIQNIDQTQNFLQKIMGIVKVRIETAGGGETEGNLEFVKKDDAERIKLIIRKYQVESDEKPEIDEAVEFVETPQYENEEETIFSMDWKQVLLYGALRFRPLVLVIVAWIFSFGQQFFYLGDFEEVAENEIRSYVENLDVLNIVLVVIVTVVTALLVSWMLDIALTFNSFYKFTLSSGDNKLYTTSGLFSSKKSTIPLKKLQSIQIYTNFIRRKLGFYGLSLQTAGYVLKEAKGSEVLVPFTKFESLVELAKKIRDFAFPDNFTNVSRKTIRRSVVRYLIYIIPGAVSAFLLLPGLLWALLITPLFYYLAVLRYQYRGYHYSKDTIIIKQGFFYQYITIIPLEKIQTLSINESFFQRRLSLATLSIDTAAFYSMGGASIIDIEKDDAARIMDEINEYFKRKYDSIATE